MNKLRIDRSDDIYEIEVNDAGDTIQFDITDIELPMKLQAAYDGINKAQNELKTQLIIIDKRQDVRNDKYIYSKNESDKLKAYQKCFKEMRIAVDCFLGEGGCQKVFGDANYLEMYDDLFTELNKKQDDGLSHLEHLQIKADSIKNRIEKKYGGDKKQVI